MSNRQQGMLLFLVVVVAILRGLLSVFLNEIGSILWNFDLFHDPLRYRFILRTQNLLENYEYVKSTHISTLTPLLFGNFLIFYDLIYTLLYHEDIIKYFVLRLLLYDGIFSIFCVHSLV